jgi:uncharacterized membrane protein YkvA (DUF1232 family)
VKASAREWAAGLKRHTLTLYYAARDPRAPWHAKLIAGLVVAYAVSPIDLIPDFIPVIGYLDDLLIVPAGIWLALRLMPPEVMQAAREKAQNATERPTSVGAAVIIALIWLALVGLFGWWLYRLVA